MSPLAVIFLVAGTVLGLLGLVLLRFGVWPRRRGSDPHCRGCGYLLVATRSGHCPECGRELSPRNVVRGTRERRRGPAAAGVATCLLAGACLWCATSPRFQEIDWYPFYPTKWLVEDVRSQHLARRYRAWRELARRRALGTISESAERELTETVLAARPAPFSRSRFDRERADYLADRFLSGRMPALQTDRFFSQCFDVGLSVAPRVVPGEVVTYLVTCRHSGPGRGWYGRVWRSAVYLDGQDVGANPQSCWEGSFGGSALRSMQTRADTAGRHVLRVNLRCEVFHSSGGTPPATSAPCWSRELSLEQPFQAAAPEPVKK